MKRSVFALPIVLGVLLGANAAETNVPPDSGMLKFIAAKRRQAEMLDRELKLQSPRETWEFFDAAAAGDRKTAAQLHDELMSSTPVWTTIDELHSGLKVLALPENRFIRRFGDEIVRVLPAGAIYLGGTEPAHYAVTAVSESRTNGPPFFIVIQRHFADGAYLDYIDSIYRGKMTIPSRDDLKKINEEYRVDLRRRWEHDQNNPGEPRQLKPGEDVRVTDDNVEINSMIGITQIYGLVTKLFFDRNPEREFYVEEGFPLEWMYPHLVPHGPVMRLSRKALDNVSAEAVQKSREYWSRLCQELLGMTVKDQTPVADLCEFIERVDVARKLDGFAGQAAFVRDDDARKSFSKLRSSQAGLYFWRISNARDPAEKKRYEREATVAFKEAYLLSPKSPETMFRFINLLVITKQIEQALAVTGTSQQLDPANKQLEELARELRRMQNKSPKPPPPRVL